MRKRCRGLGRIRRSVAAAVLADRWPDLEHAGFTARAFEQHVAEPCVSAITSHDMRNRGLTRWGLTRLAPRRRRVGAALGVTMARHLVRAQRVCELPRGLQVVITATDLVAGRALRMSQEFTGGWDYGYGPTPPRLTVATALGSLDGGAVSVPACAAAHRGARARRPRAIGAVRWSMGASTTTSGSSGSKVGIAGDRPQPAQLTSSFRSTRQANCNPSPGDMAGCPRSSVARKRSTPRHGPADSAGSWISMLSGKLRGVYVPIDRDPASFRPPAETPPVADVADGALPARVRRRSQWSADRP